VTRDLFEASRISIKPLTGGIIRSIIAGWKVMTAGRQAIEFGGFGKVFSIARSQAAEQLQAEQYLLARRNCCAF
jgi:hypothetical protein